MYMHVFSVRGYLFSEWRIIYRGLYMVGGYDEGYFFPTWVAA
jgi:hypothetical protein